ncbi:MAG: hypothetical protein WA130_11480 [Candidatus Methanoperedens sp.]
METDQEKDGVKGEQPDPEETEVSEEELREMLLTQRVNIKIVLQSKLILLSPLKFEDYPLTRVLSNSNFQAPTEYQSLVMAKLINTILARSKLTPGEMDVLREDLLKTYHVIGSAIEKALTEVLTD